MLNTNRMVLDWILDMSESFWGLTAEMAPFLLLGFLFAGLLHVGISQNFIKKYLGKNTLSSIFKAALFGVPLPLCSCGVIPTGISLYKNGAAKGPTVSFLISTPQTGVDSIMLTWSMLGLPFAIIRPVVALVTGVVGGLLTTKLDAEETKEIIETKPLESNKPNKSFLSFLKYGFVEMPADIAKWLVIGLFLAALVDVMVPTDLFADVSANPFMELGFVLLLAVPLYVCATGSIPIAAVLLLKGLSPGAALVFLMAGPATNIATMTVIGKSMGRKTLVAYLSSIVLGAIVFGFMVNMLLPKEWFEFSALGISHDHTHGLSLFDHISAVVLFVILISSYIYMKFSTKTKIDMKKDYTLTVTGMNCQHCQNSVQTNIEQFDGVKNVEVDLKSGEVNIEAEELNLDAVKEKIRSLGFDTE